MKTAEDIFNKHCTLVTKDWHEYIILSKEKFIAEIEAYASERTRDELIVPSEEEIRIAGRKHSPTDDRWKGFDEGARWAISEIKKLNK